MKLQEAIIWSLATTSITCFLGWTRDLSKGKSSNYFKAVRTPIVGIFFGNAMYPYFTEPISVGMASAICERWLMLGFKSIYAFYYPKHKWI